MQPVEQEQQSAHGSQDGTAAGLAGAAPQSDGGRCDAAHDGVNVRPGGPWQGNGHHERGLQGRWQRLVFIGIDLQEVKAARP